MKVININLEVDDLINVKYEFENLLIEKKIIEKHMTLPAFVEYLGFDNSIFVYHDEFIPFAIFNNLDELYIFCSTESLDMQNKLMDALNNIEYNISNLTKYTHEELLDNVVYEKGEYFIIDGKIAA